jgi:hypothetical protein
MLQTPDIKSWLQDLTFKQWGWYLNFSAWFMEKVLFEDKKIK